ncbi:MAG TPA: cyclic peptide export ABC transporter [Methylomirabilota bacterium]|nr:cyclic peptide export ABC transporter [Methylomirabilota bacterium]
MPVHSWLLAVVAVIVGLLGGAFSAGLIALINTALNDPGRPRTFLVAAFFGLVIGRTMANGAARLLLSHFAQRALADLSRSLSRRVLETPLSQLERVGIPRILATLTHDVPMIGWAVQNIPSLAMNVAVIVGCAIYLGWLSWMSLIGLASVIVMGSLGYHILIRRAYRYLQRARDTRDLLFQHFRALTEGTKELKLHRGRREAFLAERISVATDALRRDAVVGARHHLVADTWNQMLFYGLIGGVLFAAPAVRSISSETLTGYIVTLLYVMTPVWSVMEAWSIFAQARISVKKVHDLGLSLGGSDTEAAEMDGLDSGCGWERLELDGVTFSYPPDSEGRKFVLGPIDFSLRQGELVFLIGGNGSGKSTLMKILTGLYGPELGAIRLDGVAITDKNREWYRRHFSAVFTDFYLFDSLLGLGSPDLDTRAGGILAELELAEKVQVSGGAFSTTALSHGQRKRLALLTAFLEDRPIYVFDEWAADQDPHYREVFYRRLMPELKARGKTIVVISHDDRYYHLGDRIVKLDHDRIATQTTL